ncbi:hypothetical protein SAMN05428949_0668 [Chitinophaga sp. YR627]|uniref:hypothetical protein n=1 Tax=Chitinophaga sp. YR627 TaxID=1881041 RepID=UPI0008E3A912|nr:hypothetical protein [Chitinophaga sp. YR627]SFM75245.1 hypothetical protein SAMN05428949_0668 [Chitinophaga sp. YR627]
MSYILMQGTSNSKIEKIELHDCPKCKHGSLEDRLPRGFFAKYVLGFLPLRKYMCYSCLKTTYVLHSPKKQQVRVETPRPIVRPKPVAIPAH